MVEEVKTYFRREHGQELTEFTAPSVGRDNLHFEVQTLTRAEKPARILQILSERLHSPDMGSALVYTATRRQAEDITQFLQRQGWRADAFHAALPVPEKRRIQEAFLGGSIQVICATNAFGMGIDKGDVRLVIHASIPGSLENYLQEAGRAGRDREVAECVLLYDEQDIETQFRLNALSRLGQRDIAQILLGLRRAKRDEAGEVVITAGELFRDEEVEAGFDSSDPMADTKVRTAVAWLERAGFVERNQNHTRVFQGRPLVRTMEEARARVARLDLSLAQKRRWLGVLQTLINAESDEGISADDLAELPEFKDAQEATSARAASVQTDTHRVLRTLHDMAEAGLIKKDLLLTAFIRHKVSNHSPLIFEKVCRLERAMISVMQEAEPDPKGWQQLSLRRLNQRLIDLGHESSPELLRNLLKSLALDGKGLAGQRGSLDLRYLSRDQYRVKLQRDWDVLIKTADRRRAVAKVGLETSIGKIPRDAPASGDLLVSFAIDDIARALRSDIFLAAEVKTPSLR